MRRRWTADEITRLMREADRDLAKGLTISDIVAMTIAGAARAASWSSR